MCQQRLLLPNILLVPPTPPAQECQADHPQAHRFRSVCPHPNPIVDYHETDSSRHIKRVLAYARPSDYAAGAATATLGPGLMLLMERVSPSLVGKGGFAPIMRLSGAIGVGAGFVLFYQRSVCAFPGLV